MDDQSSLFYLGPHESIECPQEWLITAALSAALVRAFRESHPERVYSVGMSWAMATHKALS